MPLLKPESIPSRYSMLVVDGERAVFEACVDGGRLTFVDVARINQMGEANGKKRVTVDWAGKISPRYRRDNTFERLVVEAGETPGCELRCRTPEQMVKLTELLTRVSGKPTSFDR